MADKSWFYHCVMEHHTLELQLPDYKWIIMPMYMMDVQVRPYTIEMSQDDEFMVQI